MRKPMRIHSQVLIFTASAFCVVAQAGCVLTGSTSVPEYRHVELQASSDPLAPAKSFPAWTPPRQMAVWVHPHRDSTTGAEALVGGHWVLLLLGKGTWYTEVDSERDPVPNAEATPEEIEAGRATLLAEPNAVIPYRHRGER